jgi:hypothetical protein
MTSLITLKRANTASCTITGMTLAPPARAGVMQLTWGMRRVILAFFAAWAFHRFDGESTPPKGLPQAVGRLRQGA